MKSRDDFTFYTQMGANKQYNSLFSNASKWVKTRLEMSMLEGQLRLSGVETKTQRDSEYSGQRKDED